MRLPKLAVSPLLIAASLIFVSASADSTQAQQTFMPTTHKVQVEYWFWRSGGTYWSTVLETNERQEAELMYELLLWAFEAGEIDQFLATSFDFIVVDVRMTTEHSYQLDVERLRAVTNRYQTVDRRIWNFRR